MNAQIDRHDTDILILGSGGAGLFAALPNAGRLGVPGLGACLFGMGFMSGPFIPASTLMKVNWVSYGPSRAWALYVISLGCIFSIAAIFPASLDHRYLQDTVPLKSTSPRLNGACNAQVWVYALGFTLTFYMRQNCTRCSR